ncbi:hypothetical protein AVEN_249994-1 [Araneus ventricosus]|uniref:Uncharacterized protein n=1 Tax=Araneus ventricosus TaxID=182803 RepID=A0A4Y2LR06_ARAVE|nr:hypothetical protein AVEN_249994-1 [Araneus ventricosus]
MGQYLVFRDYSNGRVFSVSESSAGDFTCGHSNLRAHRFNNGTLDRSNGEESDAGSYLCQVSNGITVGLSKIMTLQSLIREIHFGTLSPSSNSRKNPPPCRDPRKSGDTSLFSASSPGVEFDLVGRSHAHIPEAFQLEWPDISADSVRFGKHGYAQSSFSSHPLLHPNRGKEYTRAERSQGSHQHPPREESKSKHSDKRNYLKIGNSQCKIT